MAETLHRTDTIHRAVAELRERLDPDHTLPDNITFEIDETFDFTDRFPRLHMDRVFIQEDGEPIGKADLVIRNGNHESAENYAHFNGIRLHHSCQGRGVGLLTYMWAIERAWEAGVPFRTQTLSQSPDARRMWEYLETKGVARCDEPFVLDYERDGIDRYIGRFVVPVPVKS